MFWRGVIATRVALHRRRWADFNVLELQCPLGKGNNPLLFNYAQDDLFPLILAMGYKNAFLQQRQTKPSKKTASFALKRQKNTRLFSCRLWGTLSPLLRDV